ncbi:MAG: Rab family GTPase [Candidatus Odinarchaeota archaeon]
MGDRIYNLKIIIIGDPGVGKTSLVKKFISGQFSRDYKASIGTNLFIKKMESDSDEKISLNLWDIAGQERWVKMRHLYYSGSDGALIVGDITRKNTFYQITKFWTPDLKKYCRDIPLILLANKNDLKLDISKTEIEEISNKINANSLIYTSARNGEHVEEAFKLISDLSLKFSH